jgi:amino acid adenylation domain-containing protein
MTARHLVQYLTESATRWPDRTAVVGPDGRSATYEELDRQSSLVSAFFITRGIRPGDRVGVVLPKSVSAVTSLFGILKAGAAYVPVDVTAPAERGRKILTDCRVRGVVLDARAAACAPSAEDGLGAMIVVGNDGAVDAPGVSIASFDAAIASGAASPAVEIQPSDLAYILYTSGSTGVPKGVMLTHENATSFVDWCSATFAPSEQDRFSSHAPFHFDLSVLDIYLSIKHGATLFLIGEDVGKSPKDLARLIAKHRLTVWYSTPSILTLLTQFGNLADQDCSSLRLVFFAGEVFPVKHLRRVKEIWPAPVYYNLYGPTETNVCTYARIPAVVPEDRTTPYPIGFPCAHCDAIVLDGDGREVPPGEEGLLYISGPSLFQGYWNRPAENAAAFTVRNDVRWYNTGDVVRWDPQDGYLYVGRRDRMVKRRGYRIELGEIERALYLHPAVREAAVTAVPDSDAGVKIVAFLACHGTPPSIIDLKAFCGGKLPAYMSPDRFVIRDRLPKTSTDKVDYQALKQESLAGALALSH